MKQSFVEHQNNKDLSSASLNAEVSGSKRRRLVFIIDKLVYAGCQKHLLHQAVAMKTAGYDVEVICLERGGPLEAEFEREEIKIHIIGISKWNSLKGLVGIWTLRNLIKRLSPHLVQCYLFTANVFGAIAARGARVPVIVTGRRDLGDWKSARQIKLNKFANKYSHKVTANSLAVAEATMLLEGVAKSKLHVIHNGISGRLYQTGRSKTELRKSLNLPEGVSLIGTVSNIREEKDPLTLLRAFVTLSHKSSAELVYAGGVKDDALMKRMQDFLKEKGLENRVHFLGSIQEVHELLGALDVFVFTSKSEGFSNAVLEAMASGLPVVASSVGGNVEQVVDGLTGYLAPVGDDATIAESLYELLKSPERIREMGKEGALRIKEHFDVEDMGRKMKAFYDEQIDHKVGSVK